MNLPAEQGSGEATPAGPVLAIERGPSDSQEEESSEYDDLDDSEDSSDGDENLTLAERRTALILPMKEAAYTFILCLRRRSPGMLVGDPNFNRSVFGPFLCPYLYDNFQWNGNIREAVTLWCNDRAAAEEMYGQISKWNVSCVTNMRGLFEDAHGFNEDISAWDTSNVFDMDNMFLNAEAFDQPIGGWDVSKVQSMEHMFLSATAFNQPIGGWDVSKVDSMDGMFIDCPIDEENKPSFG